MKVQSFLKYVEIQTKLASMISFTLGTALAVYRYQAFNAGNFLLMLISLLCFDMTTTAINNYMDFKSAKKKSGYGYEKHNAIVRDNIRQPESIAVIIVLGTIAVLAGYMLFLRTNATVLIVGIVSFSIGVLYSAGPVPISRTPFGEIASGLFMGFFIPFLSVFIHALDRNILDFAFDGSSFTFHMNVVEVLSILLCSVPAMMGIANIMLANNICDMEDDLENRRYTLPIYIGREMALVLFKALYFIAGLSVILGLVLKTIPITGILFFITLIPVYKNIKAFEQKQSKAETFGLAVKNFTIMNTVLIFSFLLSVGIRLFF